MQNEPPAAQIASAAPSAPVGRGRLFSAVQAAPAPSITPVVEKTEVSSTTEALAQLRLKRREESSHSSEKRVPTLQEIEAEAAPFEQHAEEAVVEAKSGTAGKSTFPFSRSVSSFLQIEVCFELK